MNSVKKKYNAKTKKQKFCSESCQYESYRKLKVERIEKICLYCNSIFLIKENDLKYNRGKYCSRECKDKHMSIILSGENSSNYGKIATEESKRKRSLKMKEIWKSDEYKKKFKLGIQKFIEKNGYHPGSDDKSKQKRKESMYKKYGVHHNWSGNYGERLCDKTTIKKYGKSAAEMLIDYSHYYGKKTDIEIIFEKILIELEIPYQIKYRIYNEKKTPFWFREYDFFFKKYKYFN